MTGVTTFQPSDLLTAWTASPVGLALLVLVASPYAVWWRRVRRAGVSWPAWRSALFLVFGVGTLAYAVCGPLAVYRTSLFWVGALQVGVLSSVTPVGLALGDPLGLMRAAHGSTQPWLVRALQGRVARALMFPAVSSVLAVGSLVLVFFTPWFELSTRSVAVEALLDVQLLVLGLLFVLPILVDELLPPWATPGVRTLLAFADGLLDAIPGILVMTAPTLLAPGFPGFAGRTGDPTPIFDQRLGGGAMLLVAEAVGLPIILAVFIEWMGADAREARVIDAELDARLGAATAEVDATSTSVPGATAPVLWWESDPRFEGRYRRRE